MRFSESLSNIADALAKVQAEIKNPLKNQINKGVQGAPKYANLEDTLQDYVRPICSKHGISIFQPIKSDENGRVGVCTVLLHKSGEFIEGDYVFCDIVCDFICFFTTKYKSRKRWKNYKNLFKKKIMIH